MSDDRLVLQIRRTVKESIRRRLLPAVLAVFILAAASPTMTGAANPAAIPREHATRQARGGASENIDLELVKLAERGDTRLFHARLQSLIDDRTLPVAARERLLERGALLFGNLAPDEPALRLIASLSEHEPQTWVWLEDGGHRSAVPMFDPAAAARLTERRWEARKTEDQIAVMIARSSAGIIDTLADANIAQRAGAKNAITRFREEQLLHQKPELLLALDQGRPVDWYVAAIATRTADVDLAAAVIAHGEPRVAIDMLDALADRLGPEEFLPLLQRSLDEPPLASHSLFLIARIAPSSPVAQTLLWRQFEGPGNGASAAAALARLSDPAVAARAASIVSDASADPALRRRALLALCLDRGDAASRHLGVLQVALSDDELGREASKCGSR